MFNVGGLEFAVIAIVALLVFGPKRLPEVSRQIGSALAEFRKVQSQVKSEIDDVIHFDDSKAKPSRASLASSPVPMVSEPTESPNVEAVQESSNPAESSAEPDASPEPNDD